MHSDAHSANMGTIDRAGVTFVAELMSDAGKMSE
eukprot:gene13191-9092_t